MDWYYHAPGRGRVGPLSAEALREHYRDRRIEPDTLVWHDGLREWQPLERMSDVLDLASVKPDATRPPPLPPGPLPGVAIPLVHATAAAAPGHGSLPPLRAAPVRKKGMSGCLIALIVCAVIAVPVIGILAAIALPAYQTYVLRSKLMPVVDLRAQQLQAAIATAAEANGRCPGTAEEAGLEADPNVDFGTVGQACAFRITVRGVDGRVDGRTVDFYATSSRNDAWDCTGGDLPAQYRPVRCRPEPEGPAR
ncbi:GYF domain-containing protein [Lysobacter xanthus]